MIRTLKLVVARLKVMRGRRRAADGEERHRRRAERARSRQLRSEWMPHASTYNGEPIPRVDLAPPKYDGPRRGAQFLDKPGPVHRPDSRPYDRDRIGLRGKHRAPRRGWRAL